MYLSHSSEAGIFVSELQTTVTLRYIISITIIILWQCTSTFGQQVWPGDVNNNGIVNNIDVLYWAVAKGSSGTSRVGGNGEFTGQDLPNPLWEESFPAEDLNYAYADCDGNGQVEDSDKEVIDNNFGMTQPGGVTPEVYETGDPNDDPILMLSADVTRVAPGGTLFADLSLGSVTDTITNFFGIAFKLVYPSGVVASQGSAIKLDLLDDSWIAIDGNNANENLTTMVKREAEYVEIAIVRKKDGPITGFGEIGTVSIVMEDIFTGKVTSEVGVTDIRLIDQNLNPTVVAPSILAFEVDTALTANRPLIRTSGIKIYPNPTGTEEVTIELKEPTETIRRVQIFDAIGRRILDQEMNYSGHRKVINIGQLPGGMYTTKVYSDRSVYVRGFFRK